jgi:hypothetical protein
MKLIPSIIKKITFRERPVVDLFIGLTIRDSWKNLELCNVLLVRHDSNCSYTFNDIAYSPLIDSIGDLFQKRGFVVGSVAKPLSRLTREKAYNSPVSYNQSFFIIEIIRFLLQLAKDKSYSDTWAEIHYLQLWLKILNRCKPNLIIGAMPKKEICLAGKALKIPVYDLQHGAITDDHPWYGERFRKNSNPQTLPDGFLVWDECGVETLTKWTVEKRIDVIKIENPWFSRFLTNDPDDTLIKGALCSVTIKVQNKPGILLTLQWGMRPLYPKLDFNGYIVPVLEQVILGTINQYNWIIRLHPVQLRSSERIAISHYLESKFDYEMVQKWISWSEAPLPVILKQVDLHITDSSSVVIEAGWMGIKSCILNPDFIEGGAYYSYYQKEREAGLAHVIPQDPDVIKRWIEESIKSHSERIKYLEISNNLGSWIESAISC